MKFRDYSIIIGVLLFILMLTACNDHTNSTESTNNNEPRQDDEEDNNITNEGEIKIPEIDMSEPITLKINDWRSEEEYETFIAPIEDEFPHITFEPIQVHPANQTTLEEQFAEGNVPDILHGPDLRSLPVLNEVELMYDLTEMIEIVSI